MHVPINVKSPNNISEWQMGFNSAFKGLMFSLVIIFFPSCTIHVTKACDSYSLYFFSHLYTNLNSIAIYFRFFSSLLQFALLNAGTSITHGGQTDRFYYTACYVNP